MTSEPDPDDPDNLDNGLNEASLLDLIEASHRLISANQSDQSRFSAQAVIDEIGSDIEGQADYFAGYTLPPKMRRRLRWLDATSILVWTFVAVELFSSVGLDELAFELVARRSQPPWGRALWVFLTATVLTIKYPIRKVLTGTLFVIFFPAVVVLIRFPLFGYRKGQSDGLILSLNVIAGFVASLKRSLSVALLLLIATVLSLSASVTEVRLAGVFALSCILCYVSWRTILGTLTDSIFLRSQIDFVQSLHDSSVTQGISDLDPGVLQSARKAGHFSESELAGVSLGLSLAFAWRQIAHGWASMLESYRASRLGFLIGTATIVGLLALGSFIVVVANLGLYASQPEQYHHGLAGEPTTVDLVNYSFATIALNDGGGLRPMGLWATLLKVGAGGFSAVVVGLLVANFVLVRQAKMHDQLEEVVHGLQRIAERESSVLQEVCGSTVEDIHDRMERLQLGLFVFSYLTGGLPPKK